MEKQTKTLINDYFATHREELISDLLELVKAESPTGNREYVNRCCDTLCAIMKKRLGAEGERYPQDEFGDHVMFKIGDGKRNFFIIGHYDTVWPVGNSMRIVYEGNTVKGPGVFDMKYGIISSIWSLKAIFDLKLPFDKTVYMFFNSDEEVGSPTSKELIIDKAKPCEAALVLEPSTNGNLKTERKGVGIVDVHITGLASHSGSNYEAGISAIDEASKIIRYLHSLTNLEKGTTVNVGVINGGSARNVVAAECKLLVDFRVKTAEECEKLLANFNAIKPSREGITVKVNGELNRPPMEKTKGNIALYKKLAEVAGNMEIEIHEMASGGGSDGNFTSALGVPTIDGMGAVGDGGHALSEHIVVDKSIERTILLCAYWSAL